MDGFGTIAEMPAGKTPTVPSVRRAFAILEMLAASRAGLTLPELSRRLGLPKSSVHCLLLTLEEGGYLERSAATRRYTLGVKLFNLANAAFAGIMIRKQAQPFLHALMQETGLTVHLAILEQNEAVLVTKLEPLGNLRLATWQGKRMDLHCTGVGKALIAHIDEDELSRILLANGLPRHNENTIVSISKLRSQLAEIRRRGYSVDDEEDEIGTRCLGAPIFDASGAVVAAISIAGTVDQFSGERLSGYAARLVRTASEISATLNPVRLAE